VTETMTSTESTETLSVTDILTHDQINSRLHHYANLIGNADDDFSKAEKAYLSSTHPSRHASDEAQAISERDFLPALEEAERLAVATARAARSSTIAIRDQVASTEIPTLTRADMEAAGHIAGLIETDSARMALRQLIVEVKAALASGDKPRMYVWHRALGARLSAPSVLDRLDSEATTQLNTARRQMAEKLRDRSGDPIRDRTTILIDRAHTLEVRASLRAREVERTRRVTEGTIVPFPPL